METVPSASAGHKKPIYGIYFWWGGFFAAFHLLNGILQSPPLNMTRAGMMLTTAGILPVFSAGAFLLVYLLYRRGPFAHNPAGRGTAAIWCLCLVLAELSAFNRDSLPSVLSVYRVPSGIIAALCSQFGLPHYFHIEATYCLLAPAMAAAGAFLHSKPLRFTGYFVAPAGILTMFFSYYFICSGYASDFNGSFLYYLDQILEFLFLLWTGLAIRYKNTSPEAILSGAAPPSGKPADCTKKPQEHSVSGTSGK